MGITVNNLYPDSIIDEVDGTAEGIDLVLLFVKV